MNRLAIIGSNDLAELIAHHAPASGGWEVVGFFDNRKPADTAIGTYGHVLGDVNSIESLYAEGHFDFLAIGIGYTQFPFRKETFERFKGTIPFANIIHESTYVDPSAVLGEGIVVLPGSVLDFATMLGDNVLLNTGVRIAHHTRIEAHSFIGPGVVMAGKSVIEECCFIGVGATITDNVTIAARTLVGAGSLVAKDIVQAGTYVGCPARRIKDNSFYPND